MRGAGLWARSTHIWYDMFVPGTGLDDTCKLQISYFIIVSHCADLFDVCVVVIELWLRMSRTKSTTRRRVACDFLRPIAGLLRVFRIARLSIYDMLGRDYVHAEICHQSVFANIKASYVCNNKLRSGPITVPQWRRDHILGFKGEPVIMPCMAFKYDTPGQRLPNPYLGVACCEVDPSRPLYSRRLGSNPPECVHVASLYG